MFFLAPAMAGAEEIDVSDPAFMRNERVIKHENYDISSGPIYREMVRKVLKEQPRNYSFSSMRANYSLTQDYMPQAGSLYGDMEQLAQIVKNSADEDKAWQAAQTFQAIAEAHLAHMGVILFALSYARDDPRFGDVQFYEWVRDGLLRSVMRSGNGQSLDGAYDVINPEEEEMLLHELGEKWNAAVEYTETKKRGIIYYNRHYMRDGDGELHQVYVNLTRPMERIIANSSK